MMRFIVTASFCLCIATPAIAREETVTVDAKAGPWSVQVNPKMPYGLGNAAEPAVVKGIEPDSGKAEIYAEGKISVGGKEFPSIGDEDKEVDDSNGKNKKRFPSFYTPKVLYPAYAHGLVATFIDGSGKIVGRPIMVGEGIRVPIPENATGLSLGINDDDYSDNTGSFVVKLVLPD